MARRIKRQRVPPQVSAEVVRRWGNDCWIEFHGCAGTSTTSDHIVPYAAGGRATVPNIRRACLHCNSARHDRILSGFGANIHAVIGPPCAGKSEWVKAHAPTDAIVLDYSSMAKALAPATTMATAVAAIAMGAWSGAYNSMIRCTEPVDVWIVKALPLLPHSPHLLEEWIALDYRIHVVDPGVAVVFDRLAANQRGSSDEEEARRWYSLGITQQSVDAAASLRHARLRSLDLLAVSETQLRPRW